MAFDVFFCGMDLMVRVWKDGDPAIGNEDSRHEVFIVGAKAGGEYGLKGENIPEHKAHLAVPALRLTGADVQPDLLIESAAGPLAIWSLDGISVDFPDAASDGVAFRDRLRPLAGSPHPPTPGDWEDIAWVCDYERAAGARPALGVDLHRPAANGPASYIARLNSGMMLAQPPRRVKDRMTIYDFGNGYAQALTDTVRWKLPKVSRIRLREGGSSDAGKFITVSGGPVHFTSLSTSILDLGAAEMDHFSGFGSLFDGRPGPIPTRRVHTSLVVDGEVGSSGGICLRALYNVRQDEIDQTAKIK